jgi:hypothetical protein
MDTLRFFETVLADDGTNYLVLFPKGKPFKLHKPFSDLTTMAQAMQDYDASGRYDAVYHACGGYQAPFVEVEKDGELKKKYRVAANWHRAKSFWVDLDCGQSKFDEGKGYLTKQDAARAIFAFSDKIKWPRPMLVDSGYGLHAYWPLEKTIKHDVWLRVARVLKSALEHSGVKADPTRTADFASILRPAGALNRKNGAEKSVKVLSQPNVGSISEMAHNLKDWTDANQMVMPKQERTPVPAQYSDLNSDLTAHLPQYPEVDCSGELVADGCLQMQHMRDTQGDVDYETWRMLIGVLTHCVDGEDLAQTWSEEREATGHTNTDWKTRFDSWSAGPSTCEKIEKCNPKGCEGCKFKGKVTTPLQLGRVIPITKEHTVEIVAADNAPETVTVPALPHGYGFQDGVLYRVIKDKDDVHVPHTFCHQLFYPISRIRSEDGTFRFGIRVHLHDHRIRDFDMPAEAMASQTDVLRSLAKYEVMQSNHKDAGNHLTAYLRESIERLKREVEEVNTLTSFGWKYDMQAFLIGDRLYHKDGSMRRVLLGGYAAGKSTVFKNVKGSLKGYSKAMDFIYSQPEMEPLQYAICSNWGSLLTPFCEDTYRGVVLSLYGGTAKGKTTACLNALHAFGDPAGMSLKSDRGFTENALWATMGAMNNIPLLLDEMTNVPAETMSRIAYTVSQGEERSRLINSPGGTKFAKAATWAMSPTVTSNTDLHTLLSTNTANAEAEGVRVVQLNMDIYDLPTHQGAALQAFQMALDQIKANSGAAGEAMVKYCVTHVDDLYDRMRDKVLALAEHVPETKFRFYRSHAACTLVMAEITRELGIHSFDCESLELFAIRLMKGLRSTIASSSSASPEDAYSRMVAEFSNRIVVTTEYRDGRHASGPESPRRTLTGTPVGRYVVGSRNETKMAGRLFLCHRDVRDWCMKNRVDMNGIVRFLTARGALISEKDRVTITRGTDMATVVQRCLEIDSTKIDMEIVPLPQAETLRIQAVGGGV